MKTCVLIKGSKKELTNHFQLLTKKTRSKMPNKNNILYSKTGLKNQISTAQKNGGFGLVYYLSMNNFTKKNVVVELKCAYVHVSKNPSCKDIKTLTDRIIRKTTKL